VVRPPGPKQCTTAKLRPGPLHGPAAIEARVPRAARLLPVAGLTGRSAAGEDRLTRNLVYGWVGVGGGRLVVAFRRDCEIAALALRMVPALSKPGPAGGSPAGDSRSYRPLCCSPQAGWWVRCCWWGLVSWRRCRYRSLVGGRQPPHPKRGSTADRPGGARPRPPPPGGGRAADRARRSGGAGRRRSSCGTPPRRPPTGRPSGPRG